jgi:hypothetical protein
METDCIAGQIKRGDLMEYSASHWIATLFTVVLIFGPFYIIGKLISKFLRW